MRHIHHSLSIVPEIVPLGVQDQDWVAQLAHEVQVYCPDCAHDGLGYVARIDNQAAAYIVWQKVLDEATLLGIAVQGCYQRQGIARALHLHSENQLITQGVKTLFLEVRAGNTTAQKCYTSLGYQPISIRRAYYRQGNLSEGKEDAIVMRKNCG